MNEDIIPSADPPAIPDVACDLECSTDVFRRLMEDPSDAAAWARLYRAAAPRLLGVIRRAGVRASEADDVLQEVMMKAHDAFLKNRIRGSFGAWLNAVAFNTATNHVRKPVIAILARFGDSAIDPEDPTPSLWDTLRDADLARAARECYEAMSGRQKFLVNHCWIEGNSCNSADDLLGMARGISARWLRRVRLTALRRVCEVLEK